MRKRFRTLKTPSFGNFWPQNPLHRPFLATPLHRPASNFGCKGFVQIVLCIHSYSQHEFAKRHCKHFWKTGLSSRTGVPMHPWAIFVIQDGLQNGHQIKQSPVAHLLLEKDTHYLDVFWVKEYIDAGIFGVQCIFGWFWDKRTHFIV